MADLSGTESVAVRVLDDGVGVAEGEEERVFELFYRSASTARRASGAGIGPYVRRVLVEAMGGRIGRAGCRVGAASSASRCRGSHPTSTISNPLWMPADRWQFDTGGASGRPLEWTRAPGLSDRHSHRHSEERRLVRVAPRELRAVRRDGMLVRFAMLGPVAYVEIEVPPEGSAGSGLDAAGRGLGLRAARQRDAPRDI